MTEPLLILGAGAFAREVQDVLESLRWPVSGFVVDVDASPKSVGSFPVYHVNDPFLKPTWCVCGITSPERIGLVQELEIKGFSFLSAFHPEASVSAYSFYPNEKKGALVNRGASISRNVQMGLCVVVNRNASIGHDCIIGDCATIGPGAHLAGNVRVGNQAQIGMGALIREGVTIGRHAVIGMGAVVLQDVPAWEKWWGVPARRQESG